MPRLVSRITSSHFTSLHRSERQARERGKKEKMARIAGANYTDEATLKHTYTLITVDRDAIGGDSVERSESE